MINPEDFIITRKRKKYKFALFANSPLCFEADEWDTKVPIDILEIGAGTGLFGVELARRNFEWQVLAVDVKADRLQTGARKAEADNIRNIRFLRARADMVFSLLPAASLRELWITFPDPFPKKRSAGRRLTHPHFLEGYQTLLNKDGALYFKTDAHQLFDWSLEQLVEHGWRIQKLSYDLHDSDLNERYKIMTTYETKFTGEGLPIHFVKAAPPSDL